MRKCAQVKPLQITAILMLASSAITVAVVFTALRAVIGG